AGDIMPHKQGFSTNCADLLGGLEAHLFLDIGQHHPGAFMGEKPCCRPTKAHELPFDTRSSAGDQCHFPCQSHRSSPRRWSSQHLSLLLSVAQYTPPRVRHLIAYHTVSQSTPLLALPYSGCSLDTMAYHGVSPRLQ